ncbi:MAG: hypothetical protein HC877_19385 [Thioploca sp.]|nr:hypothetical protein [Thioploca sp.]
MQLIQIPDQTPNSAVDEEILEIFVEEVGEVLEEIIKNYKIWKSDPTAAEALKILRRCFHTLKGSGRLIGATVIGELGWRFETMLNRIIDSTLSRNDNMLFLLDQVEKVLPSMVEQFQNNQPPPYPILLLISQADYFTRTKGQSLGEFEPTVEATPAAISTTPPQEVIPTPSVSAPSQSPPTVQPTSTEETTQIDRVEEEEISENLLTTTDLDLITDEVREIEELEEFELNSLIANQLELETDQFSQDEFDLDINNLDSESIQLDDLTTSAELESLVEFSTEIAVESLETETSLTEPEELTLAAPAATAYSTESNEADLVDPGLF